MRVLIQVAEAFLVLVECEVGVARFECLVAKVFEGGGDGNDAGPGEVGVFFVRREVFIGVAGRVWGLFRGRKGGDTGELTTV